MLDSMEVLALVACHDDDWKGEVNALKKPVPQGIVWLEDAVQTVNGAEFEVRFRVNPSGAALTADDIRLDVIDETVYELYDENAAPTSSRASYVTAPAHYECVSVEPDVNGEGETLEGQWVMRVKAHTEDNTWLHTDLCVVAEYTDVSGKVERVSSGGLSVEMLPRATDALTVWYAPTMTFRAYSTKKVLTNYIVLDENKYVTDTDENGHTYAKAVYLKGQPELVMTEEMKGLFTCEYVADGSYFEVTPIADAPFWTDFEQQAENLTRTFGATLTMTDVCGVVYEQPISFTVYNQNELTVVLPVNTTDKNYTFDISEELARMGWTAEGVASLRRRSIRKDVFTKVPVKIVGLSEDGQLKAFVYGKLTPGMEYDKEQFYMMPGVRIFPERVGGDMSKFDCYVLDFKLYLKLDVR